MDAVQNRLTIAAAARQLGLSDDAVRKRLKAGKLTGFREGRQWYVMLDGLQNGRDARQNSADQADPALVEALQHHVRFLQNELERRDALILRLVEPRALPSGEFGQNTPQTRPWWSWRRWWPGARP
jgi:hypothetical protein